MPTDGALPGDGVLPGPDHPRTEDISPVRAPLSSKILEVLLAAQGVPIDLYREASPQPILQLVLALLRWFGATSYVHCLMSNVLDILKLTVLPALGQNKIRAMSDTITPV